MRSGNGYSARRSNASAEALLVATASLLSERGDLDVSFAEISQRSGVNAAMIKYYFGNKDGLLLALVERDAKHPMAALAQLMHTPLPADQKLRHHISGIISTYCQCPYLNRLIHHLLDNASSDAAERVIEIFIDPMVSAYRSIIAQGVKERSLIPSDPRLLYFSLVGACDHIFSAARSVRHVFGTEGMQNGLQQQFTEHVAEMLLSGLRPRPQGEMSAEARLLPA